MYITSSGFPPAFLRLSSGVLYVGITRDLQRRLTEHFRAHGSGSMTTADAPRALLYSEYPASHDVALKRERLLKHWSRAKK